MQIATAAEEQAAVSEEVNRNIVNINGVLREKPAPILSKLWRQVNPCLSWQISCGHW